MKYIVVKVWYDGDISTVKPSNFLSIDEARSLAQMYKRLDPDNEYIVMQQVD